MLKKLILKTVSMIVFTFALPIIVIAADCYPEMERAAKARAAKEQDGESITCSRSALLVDSLKSPNPNQIDVYQVTGPTAGENSGLPTTALPKDPLAAVKTTESVPPLSPSFPPNLAPPVVSECERLRNQILEVRSCCKDKRRRQLDELIEEYRNMCPNGATLD